MRSKTLSNFARWSARSEEMRVLAEDMLDPRPRRSCSAWRRITAVWPSGPQRWLLWPVPQPRQRRLQWIQPPGARVRLIAGMGRPPRRSQNDDDLPTAMAFRIGLSRYQANFPRAWPGLCHQRKPGDGGRSAMPPAASRHFSSRLAERSSRGRGLFHEPVPQSLLVQLRSLRPDRRQVALRASLRITSLNLSPARRWDFSLSSIQRSSQIRLAPCSSTGFS